MQSPSPFALAALPILVASCGSNEADRREVVLYTSIDELRTMDIDFAEVGRKVARRLPELDARFR